MVSSWQQDMKVATQLVTYVARQSNVVTGAQIPTHPEQPVAPPPPPLTTALTGICDQQGVLPPVTIAAPQVTSVVAGASTGTITWNPVAGATGYRVRVNLYGSFNELGWTSDLPVSASSFTTGMGSLSFQTMTVSALDGNGNEGPSQGIWGVVPL